MITLRVRYCYVQSLTSLVSPEITRHDYSIIACSRHIYVWCCSSRTSRSWWITQSTQHHRRGCNSTKVSVDIRKSPRTQYRRYKVAMRTTCIKNVKFTIMKIRPGWQYVANLCYSKNLNWAAQNLWLGRGLGTAEFYHLFRTQAFRTRAFTVLIKIMKFSIAAFILILWNAEHTWLGGANNNFDKNQSLCLKHVLAAW